MADQQADEQQPARPMAGVASALADFLTEIGWDGSRDVIAGEVRRPSDGTTLGRVEIHLLPISYTLVDGQLAQVTPTAFIPALRASWSQAVPPPLATKPQATAPAESEIAVCDLCADLPALHTFNDLQLCCACYIRDGGVPSDWHVGCMESIPRSLAPGLARSFRTPWPWDEDEAGEQQALVADARKALSGVGYDGDEHAEARSAIETLCEVVLLLDARLAALETDDD